MLFLKKHWRWTVPATLVVLCLVLGSVLVVRSNTSTPTEPERIYATPERTGDIRVNIGGIRSSTIPTTRSEIQPKASKSTPVETPTNADSAEDLEPLDECCDDEVVLNSSDDNKLSKEEREKRLKIIKDFFEELDRGFESIDTNREALFARADELEENYFAYIDAIVDLLSPKYQQRFDEIETSEELTQGEIDGINDELQVIGQELGIEIDDFMQDAADEFRQKFESILASIDQIDDDEAQLITEMEDFPNDE